MRGGGMGVHEMVGWGPGAAGKEQSLYPTPTRTFLLSLPMNSSNEPYTHLTENKTETQETRRQNLDLNPWLYDSRYCVLTAPLYGGPPQKVGQMQPSPGHCVFGS